MIRSPDKRPHAPDVGIACLQEQKSPSSVLNFVQRFLQETAKMQTTVQFLWIGWIVQDWIVPTQQIPSTRRPILFNQNRPA